jgi:putative PEP-CTERM system histidine kinase
MDRLALDVSDGSALMAALVYSAFTLRLVQTRALGRGNTRLSLLFGAAVGSSSLWGWTALAEPYFQAVSPVLVGFLDLTRYGCWFAFLLALIRPILTQGRRLRFNLLAPVAGVLLLLGLATLPLGAPASQGSTAGRMILFEAVALPVFGLILVEQLFHNVAEASRWNAKPLCLGLSVVFLFDVYVYSQAVLFGRLDGDAVSLRGAIHALAVPLLHLASRGRSDWLARLRVSQAAVFHSTALVLVGAYLLAVSAIGYYIRFFGGAWGSALQLVALFAALIFLGALAMSGSMRSRLRVMVGKHFFSYRYDYREEWLRFTTMLSERTEPSDVRTQVIRGMADLVESPSGALWLQGEAETEFVQAARWNVPALVDVEPVDSAFSRFLSSKRWVIDLHRFRSHPQDYAGLTLPTWLASADQLWLVIPLIVADELTGFAVLGDARTPLDLDWEVIDLLKTASRQAAGSLAQMRATEALLEARKFDAFNRMSAFVVHDLKNIVTQLSLMLKNAKRLHANPEFQKDMLATVENSLEKMRQLMLQLRQAETPHSGQSSVDLVPIVRRIQAGAAERGRTVEVRIDDPVVTRGNEERMERVLGHVVQNALEATLPTQRVWLKLSRDSDRAQVEIGDTGRGMSQEYVRTRLFKPFQTDKQAGMGIGAYETFQYVRELGGDIRVESELDRGTLMTISLPLLETHKAAELQIAEVTEALEPPALPETAKAR